MVSSSYLDDHRRYALGETRVGIFATENIKAGSELTFDYQFERFGVKKQQCFCGESNCRGFLGEKPKQLKRGKVHPLVFSQAKKKDTSKAQAGPQVLRKATNIVVDFALFWQGSFMLLLDSGRRSPPLLHSSLVVQGLRAEGVTSVINPFVPWARSQTEFAESCRKFTEFSLADNRANGRERTPGCFLAGCNSVGLISMLLTGLIRLLSATSSRL